MNAVVESELRTLSPSERILLVEEIWDRIAADPESVTISPAQRAELDRRLDALEAKLDPGRPWAEVHAELLRR
jgi:putative addiction module component (TIGR02574 family)